jgi:pyruvate/2-oxoglutarate/acetoin dehydrogenase E1 component
VSVTKINQRDAINEAIRLEMGRDPRVICVHAAGVESQVTHGLDQLFDADRVIALDPAERTVVGMAAGMALEGLTPVCEVAADELASRGLDQLAEAAELHQREGTPVPMVVRVLCGRSPDGQPDSDGPERWLLPIPGLGIVAPATASDAKGLLTTAIRNPGPFCFLEQVDMYDTVGSVPAGGHVVPVPEARIVLEGTRATVIAYGSSLAPAVQAAAELDAGIEVLDLRTLQPLDDDGILESVCRTGKALLVDETALLSAVARLVTATIWDAAFEHLDAPVRRVSLAGVASDPEDRLAARVAAIKDGCDELLAY